MDVDRVPDFEANNGERGAQVIQIENGKAVWAVSICGVLAGFAAALSIFAFYTASQSAMESRLLLQHVMELEARHAERQ
jgi:hypothetical protein